MKSHPLVARLILVAGVACTGGDQADDSQVEPDDSDVGDSDSDSDSDGDAVMDSSGFPDVPSAERYPWCEDDADPNDFDVPPCYDLFCMTPADANECPDGSSVEVMEYARLNELGPGQDIGEITGPYNRESADAYLPGEGDCCYVMQTLQAGEGRPLWVAGELRTASVIRRAGWGG